jgi:hypothetical protein
MVILKDPHFSMCPFTHPGGLYLWQVWDVKTTDCVQTFKPPPPLRVSNSDIDFLRVGVKFGGKMLL